MTARQFYFSMIIFVITLKIQKLPCFMYGALNKDAIFLALLFLVIDTLGLIATYLLANKIKENNILNLKKTSAFNFFIKLGLLVFAIYFLLQSMLFYEAIQDLFSHILFDNLSWSLFSLFLIFAIFYLAGSGLKIIGRTYEIFFGVIVVSLLVLAGFGALNTDFSVIFPLQTIKNANFFEGIKSFNLWFGDYILIFVLAVNSRGIKLKNTLLCYILSMFFVVFMYFEFYGIFHNYSTMQPSLITIISEQALLGVDIGRVDWFCILITEIGAVISSALCINIANRSINIAMPKLKPYWSLGFLTLTIYILDVFVLVDMNAKKIFFLGFTGVFAIIAKCIIFAMIIAVCLDFYFKNREKKVRL